jgi:nucleoside-diphosphate-sugar epimerase
VIAGKVLVTGATGFIGSRLCETLTLDYGQPYRALVRNFSRAARIARLDPEMAAGDMMNEESLIRAVAGCDAVLHLAHGDDRDAGQQARHLVAACRRGGVARVVHVSSMAVHGPSPGVAEMTEENAPRKRWGEAYSDAKAEAEEIVTSAGRRYGFGVVVLRPTLVYGPFSFFVTPIIEDARAGRVSLIDGGRGICNAVYVDDVCDAVMAALANRTVDGGAFLINGDDRLTWREFIETFAAMVDKPRTTVDHGVAEIEAYWSAREPRLSTSARAILRLAASPAFHGQLATVPPIGRLIRRLKERVAATLPAEQKLTLKNRLQGRRPAVRTEPSVKMPSRGRVVREAYRTWIVNDHAKKELGWQPLHRFADGAARTGDWLRFARMI